MSTDEDRYYKCKYYILKKESTERKKAPGKPMASGTYGYASGCTKVEKIHVSDILVQKKSHCLQEMHKKYPPMAPFPKNNFL